MKKRKKVLIFMLAFICFITKKNIILAETNKSVDQNNHIININEVNQNEHELNSHEEETEVSSMEFNYREIVNLSSISQLELEDDSKYIGYPIKSSVNHASYPRLKKLANEDSDGNKYIMTFQNSIKKNNNGVNVYVTKSKDLKNWTKPEILFEKDTGEKSGYICFYSSCDSVVLKDGTIIAVASRYRDFHDGFNTTALNEHGIYMRISKDNGTTWEKAQKIYTGRCWEPYILELSTGEIQIYFSQAAPAIYVMNTAGHSSGVGMISSLDKGKTWIPNVEEINIEYSKNKDKNKNNYYSAYRIAQQKMKSRYSGRIIDFSKVKLYESNRTTIDESYRNVRYK